MRRSGSGISPVVATVILVAIAIVIAIAVAFWASGLVGIFTRFEKIEISAAYSTADHKAVLKVKNTGSAPATIDDIYVNGRPCGGTTTCGITITGDITDLNSVLDVGKTALITVSKDAAGTDLKPGVTYEIAVHTASGKLYPAAVLIT